MWKSQDSCQEALLSFHYGVPRSQSGVELKVLDLYVLSSESHLSSYSLDFDHSFRIQCSSGESQCVDPAPPVSASPTNLLEIQILEPCLDPPNQEL